VLKSEPCIEGKKAKNRPTVLICGSMVGEIRKPMVIGKFKRLQCFNNMNIFSLPVIWKSNKEAWMTIELMKQWLRYFNVEIFHPS